MDKIFANIIILLMLITFNYSRAIFNYLKLFHLRLCFIIVNYFILGYLQLLKVTFSYSKLFHLRLFLLC
jgi:hypothetical protein